MNKGKQNSFFVEANTICQGPVYFKTVNQQILLCHPGNWIDQNFHTKVEQLKGKISTQSLIDGPLKENFKVLIANHLKLEFDQECSKSKDKILGMFNQMINEKKSFLNWSMACYETMSKLDHSIINDIHERDVNIFRKAHLSASVAIWLSLTNDFYEPGFLEDIYHVTFLQDSGLVDSEYSYYIAEALDQERRSPGTGIRYLVNHRASDSEIKLFKEHSIKSFEFISKLGILNNPDLASSVLAGHELGNGEGFPYGYTGVILTSWEKIIILADHLVEYRSTIDFSLENSLENIRNLKLDLVPVKKVLARSMASISSVEEVVA